MRVGRILGFGRLVVKVCEFGGLEVELFRQFLFLFLFLEFARVCWLWQLRVGSVVT